MANSPATPTADTADAPIAPAAPSVTAPPPAGPIGGWLARRRRGTRYGLALLAGLIAALAWPPLGWAPLLWLCFPVLALLLRQAQSGWQAALTGWCFAFGYLALGLYWVAAAMLVDPSFAWMIPITVLGLPGGLALIHALAAWAWWKGWRAASIWAQILALAVLWTVAEWLRGHLLTGFPWHLIGYVWVDWLAVLQSVSLIGVYGLSLLTVAAALLPAWLDRPGARLTGSAALAFAIGVFVGLGLWGAMRLAEPVGEPVEGVRLRLVQPNIAQENKWDPDLWPRHFALLRELSTEPPADGEPTPTHVIWPETAVPYFLSTSPQARQALGAIAPPGGALLTGAPRRQEGPAETQYFNALAAVDETGEVVASYAKHHLVPFGEYVPLRAILPGFVTAVAGRGNDYSAGPGPRTLAIPGLPEVGPSICYEAIFPGAVVAGGQDRPAWMLNITNDAWFGRSAGPHQHFAIARTRAVEEGLPLIRVAGTGITAVVDAHGRVLDRLGLGQRGVIDTDLPAALPATLYARWGDWPAAILAVLLFAGALAGRSGRALAPRALISR